MTAASLKDLYERKLRAMTKRPSFARATGQARVRLGADLYCEVEEGPRRICVDQTADEGGRGSAPPPDQMLRATLVACLAMGYRQWGARLDVRIDDVEVEMLDETDVRGQLGIADVAVGWQRIVVDVRISSPAAEADVRRVVEIADRLSFVLANLSPAIERVHRLRVEPARAAETEG